MAGGECVGGEGFRGGKIVEFRGPFAAFVVFECNFPRDIAVYSRCRDAGGVAVRDGAKSARPRVKVERDEAREVKVRLNREQRFGVLLARSSNYF